MIKDFEIGAFYSVRTLSQQLNNSITSLFNNLTNASEDLVNATDYMEFMETPSVGLSLHETDRLNPIAYEEQKKELPWLKYIEWKP